MSSESKRKYYFETMVSFLFRRIMLISVKRNQITFALDIVHYTHHQLMHTPSERVNRIEQCQCESVWLQQICSLLLLGVHIVAVAGV